jgi:deoxyuridine 5'-triphosphate nucleotidohydrolase
MNPVPTDAPCFIIYPTAEAARYYAPIAVPGGARGDSGIDLRFARGQVIPPVTANEGRPTLVSLEIRARCIHRGRTVPYMLVPRSSIGKTPLSLANSVGIIDAGYTGPLMVALRNHSTQSLAVQQGESLFQLILPSLEPAALRVVEAGPECEAFFGAEASARGEGGFGSTGAKGAGGAQVPPAGSQN